MEKESLPFSIYNESKMHHQMKNYFSNDDALFEHTIDGFIIDLYQDNAIYEIQTSNFSAIKKKLVTLLDDYPIYLIHPIIKNKKIMKVSVDGEVISHRTSPRHGTIYDIFKQTIYIPHLLLHPNLKLVGQEVDSEEVWLDDGNGSWRRKKFSIQNKKITAFLDQHIIDTLDDYLNLIPFEKEKQFTNKELAQALKIDKRIVQKFTYTLRVLGGIEIVGKNGRALLFTQRRV